MTNKDKLSAAWAFALDALDTGRPVVADINGSMHDVYLHDGLEPSLCFRMFIDAHNKLNDPGKGCQVSLIVQLVMSRPALCTGSPSAGVGFGE